MILPEELHLVPHEAPDGRWLVQIIRVGEIDLWTPQERPIRFVVEGAELDGVLVQEGRFATYVDAVNAGGWARAVVDSYLDYLGAPATTRHYSRIQDLHIN